MLRSNSHHLKHRLTGWRAGIEALRLQEQVDACGVQFAQKGYQVLQTAAEAIDGPRHHHVELAPRGRLAERVEGRALVPPLGAADAVVFVDLHDLPPGALGHLPQLALLVGRCLIDGAHPQVHDGVDLTGLVFAIFGRVFPYGLRTTINAAADGRLSVAMSALRPKADIG